MGAGASSMVGSEGWGQTSLGDMPESCVAPVLLYLDPPEICLVARLNRAFRGAASADCVWATKLPANYRYLAALAAAADDDTSSSDGSVEGIGRCCSSAATKKDKYARLCRPTPFDGGTKVAYLVFTVSTGPCYKPTSTACLKHGEYFALVVMTKKRVFLGIEDLEGRFGLCAINLRCREGFINYKL